MEILKYFLMTIEVVSCLLLILVVLVQKTKGQGMGMAFGGGMGESLFGAQVGNVLTKTTVTLAIIFLVNTTFLALLGARSKSGSVMDNVTAAPPLALPVNQTIPTGIDIPSFGSPDQAPPPPVEGSMTTVPKDVETDQPVTFNEPNSIDTVTPVTEPWPEKTPF